MQFLSEEGYSVVAFEDPSKALARIDLTDNGVDMVIVSWDAAGAMNGAEFLLRLKQRQAPFPRIVVAEAVDLDIRNRAFSLGAADLLLNPVDGERLRRSVRRALKDPKEVDPLVAELGQRLIGTSPAFLDAIVKLAQAIHNEKPTVLLIGESGVGKEDFAQLIHEKGSRARGRIEAVNLAGLAPTLIESELFGHEKGAFTGADRQHPGAFERANKGTLFLDEIGYLDLALQPKLLRAVQQRKVLRVGGSEPIGFDGRLVCATSRNLAEAVRLGTFRQDLYYRISEFEIRIPPLRQRRQDVRPLVDHFLGDTKCRLERETLAVLESYAFPGNVRELQNVLKYARTVCQGNTILPADLPGEIMQDRLNPPSQSQPSWQESLFGMTREEAIKEIEREFDRVYLLRRIREAGNNREKAARLMGVTPKTLRQKLRECGLGHLVRPDEAEAP